MYIPVIVGVISVDFTFDIDVFVDTKLNDNGKLDEVKIVKPTNE